MGTKTNPGKYDCYAKLEPDEPYFLLRGKDPVAWLLVKLWVEIQEEMVDGDIPLDYQEKLNEALTTSENMMKWSITKRDNVSVNKASYSFRQLFKRT